MNNTRLDNTLFLDKKSENNFPIDQLVNQKFFDNLEELYHGGLLEGSEIDTTVNYIDEIYKKVLNILGIKGFGNHDLIKGGVYHKVHVDTFLLYCKNQLHGRNFDVNICREGLLKLDEIQKSVTVEYLTDSTKGSVGSCLNAENKKSNNKMVNMKFPISCFLVGTRPIEYVIAIIDNITEPSEGLFSVSYYKKFLLSHVLPSKYIKYIFIWMLGIDSTNVSKCYDCIGKCFRGAVGKIDNNILLYFLKRMKPKLTQTLKGCRLYNDLQKEIYDHKNNVSGNVVSIKNAKKNKTF